MMRYEKTFHNAKKVELDPKRVRTKLSDMIRLIQD